MVELSGLSRWVRLAVFGIAGLMAGCSVVPRSRLEDCHKLSRTLEADKARLNDVVLSQRSQYNDLAQRADDDARRLRVQADENKRLLASVQAYQDERDQLATDYARVKNLLQASSAGMITTSQLQRFERFTKEHPGTEFDPVSGVLSVSSDLLFEPGRDQFKPAARPLLRSVAELLDSQGAKDQRLLVAGHTDDSPVRQASLQGGDGPPEQGHLSLDRATRVRDQLALEANIDRARIEVAGFESTAPASVGSDDAARSRNRRIEIHLFGLTASPTPHPGP